MKTLDKVKFQQFLNMREVPETTLKNIDFNGVKIKNVPVIMQKTGSVEFTMPMGTTSKIYNLLANNKNATEINYV